MRHVCRRSLEKHFLGFSQVLYNRIHVLHIPFWLWFTYYSICYWSLLVCIYVWIFPWTIQCSAMRSRVQLNQNAQIKSRGPRGLTCIHMNPYSLPVLPAAALTALGAKKRYKQNHVSCALCNWPAFELSDSVGHKNMVNVNASRLFPQAEEEVYLTLQQSELISLVINKN